jgi:hypothetical protein
MSGMRSGAPSGSGHPRLERDGQPSLQTTTSTVDRRNRVTRRILLAIVAVLGLATLLAGIRW